ncbi:MAG: hypothetical protein IT380_09955 [Myxococcales bacterium]|nr:hypothetical protein [Myxococcales bacterium]
MPQKNAVSLAFELAQLLDAVEGVRLLASPLQGVSGAATDAQVPRVVAGLIAGLSMVVARLQEVLAVVRDERDPFTLLAPHNAVPEDDDHPDLLLHRWSHERIVKGARATLSLVEKRAKGRGHRGRR